MANTIIGLIATILFAMSGLVEAIKTLRSNTHRGTPVGVSVMIVVGSLLMWVYLLNKNGLDLVVTLNYGCTFVSWMVLLVYGIRHEYLVAHATAQWCEMVVNRAIQCIKETQRKSEEEIHG